MSIKTMTHLMFHGNAEQAMKFYVGLIPDSEIVSVRDLSFKHSEYPRQEGTIRLAHFKLAGSDFVCINSTAQNPDAFSPSMSVLINCSEPDEAKMLFNGLSENGSVLMPMDDYGFGPLFGWVTDQFGVSWQVNCDPELI